MAEKQMPEGAPAPDAAPDMGGSDELTPETLQMLEDAIDAILEKVGDDPKYAQLADALSAAKEEASQLDGAGDEEGEKEDPYSFDQAEKKMVEKRKAAKDEAPAA